MIYDEADVLTDLVMQTMKFISDEGLRYTNFGNASGRTYPRFYRYFILEKKNNTKLISFSIVSNLSCENDHCKHIKTKDINHTYEEILIIGSLNLHPYFTLVIDNKRYYLEHLEMLDNENYITNWERKNRLMRQ